jgi:hypothetical protein
MMPTTPIVAAKPVIRWIFRRNSSALTCAVDLGRDRKYDVCLVPHWDKASTLVEHFDAPGLALLRHAELAQCLRDEGWVLTDYGAPVDAAA